MGMFVNPDNSAFRSAVKDEIYVDKSGLIEYTNKRLCTPSDYICNSRPRRFGKSTTANMLVAYYSKGADSEEMFSALEIGKDPSFKEHLNKYDVIHLDIQWCVEPAGGVENVIGYIARNVVDELREYYPNIIPPEGKSLFEALARIYNETGNQFVIIIDEWDVLIRDDSDKRKVQDEYISFLRSIFKGVEPTKYIALAYLTGILPIKRETTQSALNNFNEYTMIDPGPLAKYIGFTEDEVRNLTEKYNVDFGKVKRWYDGYLLDDYHVYNPKAVVSVMLLKKFRSYWSETSSYDVVVPLINMNFHRLKENIIQMLSGGEVKVNPKTFKNDTISISSKDNVLTYLIHLGYLGYRQDYEDDVDGMAFIPNEEIREEMSYAVESNPWDEMTDFLNKSESLLEATLNMDGDAVAKGIDRIHDDYVSSVKYNDENSLSSVLTIAYLSSMSRYFKPIRELPSGKGFTDFVYIPKPKYVGDYPALVVELKWNKDVESAIDQIKSKRYPESIRQYTGDILLVGISYSKKDKRHECLIEKLDK